MLSARSAIACALFGALLFCSASYAQLPTNLSDVEAMIKQVPDNPLLHYRKCRLLFAAGEQQLAFEHAAVAMEKFEALGANVPWLSLGHIKLRDNSIEVQYCMPFVASGERKKKDAAPSLRFTALLGRDTPRITRTFEVQLVYTQGEISSASYYESGLKVRTRHPLQGDKLDFATIRNQILKIIQDQELDGRLAF